MEKFKYVLRQVFSKKILIIAIVLILIIAVLLPSCYYFITINDAMWNDNEKGKPSSYTQNVQTPNSTGDSGLTVDKDAIIKDALKGLNYTEEEIANLTDEEIIEKLGINKKLKKNPKVTSLDEVTQAEILWCSNDVYSKYLDKPEELEKLLNAEIITQYPKTGTGELDGIIEFERHKEDGTSNKLTYIGEEKFDSYISSNNEAILDYFTLDDSGNILIGIVNKQIYELTTDDEDATINSFKDEGLDINLDESFRRDDGTYYKVVTTVTSKAINYKNVTQKYTLPFQYLWCLLVIGEDIDFVLELADLAYNSEIIISIYDNTTTNVEENIFTYKKETRTDKYARLKVEDDYGTTGYPTERYWLTEDSPDAAEHYSSNFATDDYVVHDEIYTVNYKVTNITNTPIYDLTKADCWIVDYSKEYEYQSGSPTQNENSKNLEEEPVEYVSPYLYNQETSRTSEEDSSLLEDEDAIIFANNIKSYIERSVNNSSATSYSRSNITSKKTNYINNIQSSIINGNGTEDVIKQEDNYEIEEDEEEEKIVIVNVDFVEYKNYDKRVERKLHTVTTVTSKTYVSGNVVNNPKVDKNSTEPNFVSILSKSEHYEAKKFITGDCASWLFEVLEENTDTVNMIDLTKYLLYKVTNDSYGITEFDFSSYSENKFATVSTSSASSLLVKYIHTWEHSTPPPTNADGTKYIIETDGAGHPTVGYGVDIYNSGYLSLFLAEGYPTEIGGEVDKEFVDAIEDEIINNKRNQVLAEVSGLNLTDYQINALISRAYNCGASGALKERNGKTFVQAYNAYWNETDDQYEEQNFNADFNHKLYTEYMENPNTSNGKVLEGLVRRRKSEWILFQTGYYDVLNEWHTDTGIIVEIAKNIHDYMATNEYIYCVYGGNSYEECGNSNQSHGLNKTFEASKSGYKHSCCATFVSWVLQEAGYITDDEHLDGANPLQNLLKGKGFLTIDNEADLQPGDILCYDHHVEIYIGDGKIYNAGSGTSIRALEPRNRTRVFVYALRAPN